MQFPTDYSNFKKPKVFIHLMLVLTIYYNVLKKVSLDLKWLGAHLMFKLVLQSSSEDFVKVNSGALSRKNRKPRVSAMVSKNHKTFLIEL